MGVHRCPEHRQRTMPGGGCEVAVCHSTCRFSAESLHVFLRVGSTHRCTHTRDCHAQLPKSSGHTTCP